MEVRLSLVVVPAQRLDYFQAGPCAYPVQNAIGSLVLVPTGDPLRNPEASHGDRQLQVFAEGDSRRASQGLRNCILRSYGILTG